MARQSVRGLRSPVPVLQNAAPKALRIFIVLCAAVLVVSLTSVHAKELQRVLGSKAEAINPVTLAIHTSLPAGAVGASYSGSVYATGGASPYRFTVFDGSLPSGLALNSTTGAVTGTPISATTSSFKLRAVDSNGIVARLRTQIARSATDYPNIWLS
jgi:hypothetical protein